ncbi:ABC transporter permease [Poseidonocella sp. HB161398]|uniref:ABC transporter permease n=1 Tax=Poseidonocella sp. HB161398 TaxID=2320855 RepID=UPI0014872087|nr:ABC transporter permease [Poseidonocella sp. HB161398]
MTVLRFDPRLATGLILLVPPVMLALLGLLWLPHDPNAMDLAHRYAAPSGPHPLGTDLYGRDVLSRVMAGGWRSLAMGIGGPALALVVAVPLSLLAALKGGWFEQALLRLNDAVLSIPTLILTLLIIVGLGASLMNAVIAIAVAIMPKFLRIAHAAATRVAIEEFVAAARIRGERTSYVMFREMLPNIMPPVIVEGSIFIGFSITAGATLSYLGLGTQPPAADWGVMIKQSWDSVRSSVWPIIGAALPIVMVILGVNLAGDSLQDRAGISKEKAHV